MSRSVQFRITCALVQAAVTLALGVPGATAFAADSPQPPPTPLAETFSKYKVDITGAPGDVNGLLKKTSQLIELKDRPPATVAALRRRVEGDEDRFHDVLESQGYYDATLATTLAQEGATVAVKIAVTPGPHYTVARVSVVPDRPAESEVLRSRIYEKPLARLAGKPARAEDVIKAEDDALAVLRDHGYPFAARGDRDTAIDHDAHTIAVTLPIKLGPRAVFGKANFVGLKTIHEGVLQRSVPWKQGDVFDMSALEQLRRYLIDWGLFASVKVAPAEAQDIPNDAPVDVNIAVVEGAQRSITLGAKYARDTGFGGTAGWTHRNLFGNAEKLDLALDATQITQTASANFAKPNFLRRNQTLKLLVQGEHSSTPAFFGWSESTAAGLERKLGTDWIVGGAVSLDASDLIQNGIANRSILVGLPVTVLRAPQIATRSILDYFVDQTHGWRLNATATPYVGSYNGTASFFSTTVEGDYYLPLDDREWRVIAARLKLGTILGAGIGHIPPDKRFYGGGGGSVRGYGYQLISPLAPDNTPIGGRALIETGLEARVKVTQTIGVVPFIDAGAVSTSPLPGGNGARFGIGAGIGVRYYTAVGPLRLDVAVPLNPRKGIDKGFQFYISFGQAF